MLANHKGEIPFVILLLPFLAGIAIGVSFPSIEYLQLLIIGFIVVGLFFVGLCVGYNKLGLYKIKWLGGVLLHVVLLLAGWILVIGHNELNNTDHFSKDKSQYLVVKINNEPVLKVQEEKKQSDLFGDLFNLNRAPKVEEVENNITVVHQLVEEEAPAAEAQEPGFEFEVKLAETEFVFETPVAEFEVEEEEMAPAPIAVAEEKVVGLDDNKSDDSIEDQLRKSKERILKLKDLSMKLRTSNGLQELENEPAYKRKQMQLQQVQHSSESQVSRFTLSNDEDGSTEIRPNNSFLHDNVD